MAPQPPFLQPWLPSEEGIPKDTAWDSLLEVNPLLGQCRLILQCRSKDEVIDHTGWSARLSYAEGVLRIILEQAMADDGQSNTMVCLRVGDGIAVSGDCMRSHTDHICISLGLRPSSAWLGSLLAPKSSLTPEEVSGVTCRQCTQHLMLPTRALEALALPTGLWQACAEALACEECAPLGDTHILPVPGKVFVSPQCYLVSSEDLDSGAISQSFDGLARCRCGAVVGETPAHAKSVEKYRKPAKKVLCSPGWQRGASNCRASGVALYKHRISMPWDAFLGNAPILDSQAVRDEHNALGDFTEAAAVGAQLLALRDDGGHSRFVILPGVPEVGAGGSDDAVGGDAQTLEARAVSSAAEALEVRIVLRELLFLGPLRHTNQSQGAKGDVDMVASCPSIHAERATKVCYRRRPCDAQVPPQCSVVVVPRDSFAAVCAALEGWSAAMPASHACAPVVTNDSLGPWLTSLLPLPPRDSGGCE